MRMLQKPMSTSSTATTMMAMAVLLSVLPATVTQSLPS